MAQKVPVLIIDDDKGLVELIKIALAEQGLELTIAYSGKDALQYLKANKPTLMVIDFSLPDYNAYEFMEELRKNAIMAPPFIVSTCQGDERIAVTMMKTGARDYLMKDFKFLENLPSTIKRVLGEIEAEANLDQHSKHSHHFDVAGNVIANLDSVIFGLTPEGLFTWLNKAIENFGYSEEDLIGKHFLDIVCKEDWGITSKLLIDILADPTCTVIFFTGLSKSGHKKKLVAYINAGTDHQGNIIVGVIHEDIPAIN